VPGKSEVPAVAIPATHGTRVATETEVDVTERHTEHCFGADVRGRTRLKAGVSSKSWMH
jgi:hypothetical protein